MSGMGPGWRRLAACMLALALLSCTASPQSGATTAPAGSGAIALPASTAAPDPNDLPKAESEVVRQLRERASLATLGPGAVEFASYMDRAASFLLTQAPAKMRAQRAGGRLAAPLVGLPPPGATIVGVYAMTSVLFQGLIDDAPGHIKDSNADNSSAATKSEAFPPETDEVTVDGNKGTITTQISVTATKYLSRISLQIKMTQEGEVRDATGALLYKISSGAIGTASGDFCPDVNGIASATYSFVGREEYFNKTGGSAGKSDRDFGGEVRFKANDDAKLASTEVRPTGGAFGEALMAPIARGIAGPFEKGWRSGVCIEVLVDPASKDVEKSSVTTMNVKLRQRVENKDLDKTVDAKLSGGVKSIEPAGKQKAPATLKYTAGPNDGDKGDIALESISNRGIGKTTVTYTVGGAWVINGAGSQHERANPSVDETYTLTIKDIKLKAGEDGKIEGTGEMRINGTITNAAALAYLPGGGAKCNGPLDHTVPMTASGTLVSNGPTSFLRLRIRPTAPTDITVKVKCTYQPPFGPLQNFEFDMAAGGHAENFGDGLGEIELPVEGTKSVTKSFTVGPLNINATMTFRVTKAAK